MHWPHGRTTQRQLSCPKTAQLCRNRQIWGRFVSECLSLHRTTVSEFVACGRYENATRQHFSRCQFPASFSCDDANHAPSLTSLNICMPFYILLLNQAFFISTNPLRVMQGGAQRDGPKEIAVTPKVIWVLTRFFCHRLENSRSFSILKHFSIAESIFTRRLDMNHVFFNKRAPVLRWHSTLRREAVQFSWHALADQWEFFWFRACECPATCIFWIFLLKL